ncbi:MAG: hypothetical protein P4L16_05560 [Chlamydiales bacterium]|nr:hypothetical protein [Chlamydiales bacterium]
MSINPANGAVKSFCGAFEGLYDACSIDSISKDCVGYACFSEEQIRNGCVRSFPRCSPVSFQEDVTSTGLQVTQLLVSHKPSVALQLVVIDQSVLENKIVKAMDAHTNDSRDIIAHISNELLSRILQLPLVTMGLASGIGDMEESECTIEDLSVIEQPPPVAMDFASGTGNTE